MSKNTKKNLVKKSTRNIPINTKSIRTTRDLGYNKRITNEPFSINQQKVSFTIENNIGLNSNKFPPNVEKKTAREKSADRIRYKSSKIQNKKKESEKRIELKNKNYVISNPNDLRQEIGELKSGICEIKSGIGEIKGGIGELKGEIREVKTEITKVDSSLNDIKNILIKGFEALFQLLQNNANQFEAKKKEFQESIDISNKNNEEKFKIIENKAELNNNPNSICNNESEKDSSNSLNKERTEQIQNQNPITSLSSSDSNHTNNKEKVVNYGQMKTSNNSYSINDTIKFKNAKKQNKNQ